MIRSELYDPIRRECKTADHRNAPEKKDIVFQVFSWYSNDEPLPTPKGARYKNRGGAEEDDDDDDEEEEEGHPFRESNYYIKLFGTTKTGESIAATVRGYRPQFFVRVPWDAKRDGPPNGTAHISLLKQAVTAIRHTAKEHRFGRRADGGLIDLKIVRRKNFWGFSNGLFEPFFRLVFKSQSSMRSASYHFERNLLHIRGRREPVRLERFESNIDPLLRFVHETGIQAAGWITLPKDKYEKGCEVAPAGKGVSKDVSVYWKDVRPLMSDDNNNSKGGGGGGEGGGGGRVNHRAAVPLLKTAQVAWGTDRQFESYVAVALGLAGVFLLVREAWLIRSAWSTGKN